jgi:hypothetical protein
MRENFEKALNFVLKWEGGYSNDPKDPGGLTIYGISMNSHPNEVKKMDELWKQGQKDKALEIAKDIYKKLYWDRIKGDELKYPFDIIVFDTAVNMGVGTAMQIYSACQGDWKDYLFLRINRYKEIALANKNAQAFLLGWLNRVMDLYKTISKGGNK